MKIKHAVLRTPLNTTGFAGVRTLGSGRGRGITSPGPKEELEYKDSCVFVSRAGKVLLIVPIEQCEYLVPEDGE